MAEGDLERSSVDVAMISQKALFPLTVMELFAGKNQNRGGLENQEKRAQVTHGCCSFFFPE